MLHQEGLPYIPEVIKKKLISRQHNNLLVDDFGIKKTQELVARKYYWPTLKADIESYVKGCDICLVLKAVKYKLSSDL